MPDKKPKCRPSGYDVVIRNINAIKDINAKLKKGKVKDPDALMHEKDRLIDEMEAACPHESVIGGVVPWPAKPGYTGPMPPPRHLRSCTSCGFNEEMVTKKYRILAARAGRVIARLSPELFVAKRGKTLRFTGINL